MKKILFLTGTRADFGKVKSLISILDDHQEFEVFMAPSLDEGIDEGLRDFMAKRKEVLPDNVS